MKKFVKQKKRIIFIENFLSFLRRQESIDPINSSYKFKYNFNQCGLFFSIKLILRHRKLLGLVVVRRRRIIPGGSHFLIRYIIFLRKGQKVQREYCLHNTTDFLRTEDKLLPSDNPEEITSIL